MHYARQNIAESGKRTIANLILEDPTALWESRGPDFEERPVDTAGAAAEAVALKTNSDVLRAMAVGWRPRHSRRFTELEWTATMMGGIRALRAAGIWPWRLIETNHFPQLYFTKAGQRENVLRQVTELVAQAAAKLGDPVPARPFIAAEYVRKEVIDNGLQTAAWALRGMILTEESMGNQQTRAAVESGVGTTLSTTAAVLAPIVPIGTIIAAIIGPIGTWTSVHSAAVLVEAERSKHQTTAFQQMYVRGMEERVTAMQMKVARRELATSQANVVAVQAQGKKDAERLAEDIGVAIKVGSGVLVVGGFSLGIVWIYRRWKRKRSLA